MISEATIITSNKRPLGDNTKSFVKRKAAKKKYKAKSVEKTSPWGFWNLKSMRYYWLICLLGKTLRMI